MTQVAESGASAVRMWRGGGGFGGSAARGLAGHFIQAAHVGRPELDQLIVVQAGDQASCLPKTSAEFRAEQLLIDGLIVK